MNDILTIEDIFQMLDEKVKKITWDTFYTERKRPAPFLKYAELPDENLKAYFENGRVNPHNALELGCGEGRNAIFLAGQGCSVTAVDFSLVAIQNAKKNAEKQGVEINFLCENVFNLNLKNNTFDFVYDSGLLHHLAPHRRITYISMVSAALKPGGHFGLVCFAWGEGAADEVDDYEFYEKPHAGIAFTEEKLHKLFSPSFDILEIRKMKTDVPGTLPDTGVAWTMLCRRK
jgi:SAM-dependent methyltransferase